MDEDDDNCHSYEGTAGDAGNAAMIARMPQMMTITTRYRSESYGSAALGGSPSEGL